MSFTTPAYFGCLKAPPIRSDLERFFFIDGDRSWAGSRESISISFLISRESSLHWVVIKNLVKIKKSSVSDGALGTLAVFPKFKICILSTANQDKFLDDLKVMLPMSVNRLDIDIATAEISKPMGGKRSFKADFDRTTGSGKPFSTISRNSSNGKKVKAGSTDVAKSEAVAFSDLISSGPTAYDDYYGLRDSYPMAKAFNEKGMKDQHLPFADSYSY
ncbi:hypothetical protein ACFE04_025396 [Oxalis oulophora]